MDRYQKLKLWCLLMLVHMKNQFSKIKKLPSCHRSISNCHWSSSRHWPRGGQHGEVADAVPCHRPDLDRGDVVLSPCQPRETRSDGNIGPGGFHCAGLASQRCSDGCRTEHCCDRGDGASGHRRRPLRLRHGHAVHAPDRSCACSRYERDKENKLRSRPVHQARCVPLIFRRVHQSHASVHFFQLPRFAFDFFFESRTLRG
jgi:hypothetical protein